MKPNVLTILLLVSLIATAFLPNSDTDDPVPEFSLDFSKAGQVEKYLTTEILTTNGCALSPAKVKGRNCLELRTSNEFSDGFVDLHSLFGKHFNFNEARYLQISLFVPKESWISALKFNFKDEQGNFGGCGEFFNNFYGHKDEWIDFVIDMQDVLPAFQNWQGDKSPLAKTRFLSCNPYCAHQADSSSIYISHISLIATRPDGIFLEPLSKMADEVEDNSRFVIDFDDDELLNRLTAYRCFESTFQAFEKGVAGNRTRAIRLKGKEENNYICFLPVVQKITGKPVNFTKVRKIFFDYYLTEDSEDFNGAWLFITTRAWDDALLAKNFYNNFERGEWRHAEILIEDLDLQLSRGSLPVLPTVYELRMDLQYHPGQKDIEMWVDNFGWE